MTFGELVDLSGTIMEGAGTSVMIAGGVIAVAGAVVLLAKKAAARDAFRSLRQNLGRAILLGLEFLVAADIVRTVSTVPSLAQVAALGGIVLIRTFLSFTLEVELEGRWPWQRRRRKGVLKGARREGHRAPVAEPPRTH